MSKISAIYVYGSRVYGNYSDNSDYDYLIIADDQILDYSCETEEEFIKKLEEHDIRTLECYFSDPIYKWESEEWKVKISKFVIDKTKLRHAISAKASHSWVKAKKKFIVEKDNYIAAKSFYHALRIILFGIQIAENGKIVNFSEAKSFWEDILKLNDWELLNKKYKSQFNYLNSKFRSLASK